MRIDYKKHNFCCMCIKTRYSSGLFPKEIKKCPFHNVMLRTKPKDLKKSAYLKVVS